MASPFVSAFRRNPRDGAIAAIAVPALGALAIDPLVTIVDTAWVARLGTVPLAAIAVAGAVFMAVFSVFNFVHVAVTPLVAGEVGRNDIKRAGSIATSAVLIGFAIGVALAIVFIALSDQVVGLFGSEPAVASEAESYLRVRFLALPPMIIATVGHGVYRGHQDTKTPLKVAVGMNIVNLVLDPPVHFHVRAWCGWSGVGNGRCTNPCGSMVPRADVRIGSHKTRHRSGEGGHSRITDR